MTFVIKKLRRSVNPVRASVCRKTYKIFENGVWGVAPSGVRAAAPHSAPAWMPGVYAQGLCKDAKPTKHTQPFTGKGGFGKDAEIRTHQALHEAKPTECPKGDRD